MSQLAVGKVGFESLSNFQRLKVEKVVLLGVYLGKVKALLVMRVELASSQWLWDS